MSSAVYRLLYLMLAATAVTAVWVVLVPSLAGVGANPAKTAAVKEALHTQLKESGLKSGSPVFIRIFKEESVLELWMKREGTWVHFRDFEICYWSGALGPKLKEGDKQSPEGFYQVSLGSLNPNSRFHLSFNLGFPNSFDRAHGRTGSYLMVHGDCVSIGCYAMTNRGISMIYPLVEAALNHGQTMVPVHIFPFRMNAENLERHQGSKWIGFWNDLTPAYTAFKRTGQVPVIEVENKRYVVRESLGRVRLSSD
ncbi:MAG: murein L,D-transpeptidase family protein [Pseudomonadota bacterium]